MNLVNILKQNNDERLRRARVFNLLRRATKADVGMELNPEVSATEEKIIKVALDMEGIPAERFKGYLEDFTDIGSQGIDLEDSRDGSFLIQASRLNALMDDAFSSFRHYVQAGPEEQLRYRQLLSRLYGSLYGLATEDQLHAAVELGREGKLLGRDEILNFNYYGPGVTASVAPEQHDARSIPQWPGKKFEINPEGMSDRRSIDEFIDAKAITVLDADDPQIIKSYKGSSLALTRNTNFERGFLAKVIEAVFLYTADDASEAVMQSVGKQNIFMEVTRRDLGRMATDKEQILLRLESDDLIAKAPRIYRLLTALVNTPEDDRGEAKYVAMEAIRSFAGGLPERSLGVISQHYEAIADHPLLLDAYIASRNSK